MIGFNKENEVIGEEEYRAILVGIARDADISYSMDELSGLAEAAGVIVLGQMVQNLEAPNRATYIGKGKVEELSEMVVNMEADTVIFNDELSGLQMRNLEDALNVRIIDRTVLILDIFATRADSAEGKLQVELAQLQYRLPRLTGFGTSLSRQGASMGGRGVGIGTRGPGEKKLETDKRHITKRINEIKAEMEDVQRTRKVQRAHREKSRLPLVALVGYTNSGKSALMNRFLEISEKPEKMVLEKDMLFATLDTRQRKIQLPDNREFLLIDTVGFVSKLPHHLIKAFKATLEEVAEADLLLHIVDASYEHQDFHIDVTNKVLKEIGAGHKEKLLVLNKSDLVPEADFENSKGMAVFISAKNGNNMDRLIEIICDKLYKDHVVAKLLIPFSRGDVSSYLCDKTEVISMEFTECGTEFEVRLDKGDYQRLRDYEIKE